MAVIWIVYLQLTLLQFRRTRRPFLLIHHAHENAPNALCMFVNMGREPVHLECVIADVYGREGHVRHFVTDYDRLTPDDLDVQSHLRQGPIQPGGYLVLGTFEDLISGRRSEPGAKGKDVSNAATSIPEDVERLELSVAVVHGPTKSHIGARRTFYIEREGASAVVRARSIHTEQLARRRTRRTVENWVEERVNPKHRGESETTSTPQGKGDTGSTSGERTGI